MLNEHKLANFEGQAHDKDGNEIFPVIINTICPVQYADQAKKIAYNHLANVEKTKNIDAIILFDENLAPIGSTEITHIFCSRFGYTNQLNMEVQGMIDLNLDWAAKRLYTIQDDPNEIKSLFCCIEGNKNELINYLGLQII